MPQHDGKIVCGCFSTVDNPEAPTVILVGGGDESGKIVKKAKLIGKVARIMSSKPDTDRPFRFFR